MPIILANEDFAGVLPIVKDRSYKYPEGLDLRPDSELHAKLVGEVMHRANEAYSNMSGRRSTWDEVDKVLTAYVRPESEKDKAQQELTYVVVPVARAAMDTLLAYMTSMFLSDPILHYAGFERGDLMGAKLLELVVAQQARNFKLGLSLYVLWRDALSYGVGGAMVNWKTKVGKTAVKAKHNVFSRLSGALTGVAQTNDFVESILYEGNSLDNVNPRGLLIDANIPIHRFQEGEYWGFLEPTNKITLLSREQTDEGYFNCQYIPSFGRLVSHLGLDPGASVATINRSRIPGAGTTPVDAIHMFINLIPREWKLGESEYPERWLFSLAGDKLLIRCEPAEYAHGNFPGVVCCPDFTGHDNTPQGRVELVLTLQDACNLLLTTHITNLRKAVNDMLVYDPSMVNAGDLESPTPGKLIRLRRRAWGQGIPLKEVIHQLQITDVTQNNVADVGALMELMKLIMGAQDSIGGQPRRSSARVTATENANTVQGAVNRLEKDGMVVSMQALHDVGSLFAYHTQEFMTQKTYARVVGDWPEELAGDFEARIKGGNVQVSPMDLAVPFDVIIGDAVVPLASTSAPWMQMFQVIAQNPWMTQLYNMPLLSRHIFRSLGVKNISDLVLKGYSPDKINSEVQQGNLVPFNEGVGNEGAIGEAAAV